MSLKIKVSMVRGLCELLGAKLEEDEGAAEGATFKVMFAPQHLAAEAPAGAP